MVQAFRVNDDARGSFRVVAVGASAGGLAPTVDLLREVGAQPGIAMVIIHHLDPTHESGLVEILSRSTPMPVTVATDGVHVEANHVYVMPPNAGLLIRQGILQVVPRLEQGGLHLPIDRFCESLARDRDGLAVGVVLSGSGFDGTEGIKAIKREGGITLAQDATASFGSMPQSAIATGCIDFILPPRDLAREIARVGAHAPSFSAPQPRGSEDGDYLQILVAMRKASGVDFTSYKDATLRRRLQRRLVLHGLTDLATYLELLRSDPAEIGALCEEVLIHVTGFFREPEVFEALRTQVFPKLVADRPRDAPIRVWVPGCSTGEEVYSIAISLLEFMQDALLDLPIKIFGTDISLAMIDKARAGKYPESIEREVSQGRLQRFFSKDEGGYRIRRDVRDLAVFAKHDVTRDPPFSAMDLASCRNLMIYLGPELQDRAVALLHYSLKELGFLVLGSAETIRAFAGFAPVDGKNRIYARTSAAPRVGFDISASTWLPPDLTQGPGAAVSVGSAADLRSFGSSDMQREADRLVLASFAPPGVVVTNDLAIVQFRGQTGHFLEPAPGLASFDLLRMVRDELRTPLRRAIDCARSSQSPVREAGVTILVGEKRRTVLLEVIPFTAQGTKQRFFLVLFEDDSPREAATQPPAAGQTSAAEAAESALRRELASTRQYLESVIAQLEATNEELKAANEESVSNNEELRSTNEELQSAKEELQATNEELRTLNDEMGERNVEALRLSDDLSNVLTSIEIPILIVGRDLRLRRFTPAAARVFGLLANDLACPLSDIPRIVENAPVLLHLVREVLEQLRPADCTALAPGRRWHHFVVRPYVTLDGRIDGTVLTARDIDDETRAKERLAAAQKYAEEIVETIHEGLIVLDRDFRVRSANKAFLRMFRLEPKDVEGRHLPELGRRELAMPALGAVLDAFGDDGATVEDSDLVYGDGADGMRVFRLNVRRIGDTALTLVALEDVTEVQRAESLRRDAEGESVYRDRLQGMAFEAAVTEERERRRLAVVLHDGIGQDLALAKLKLASVCSELVGERGAAAKDGLDLIEHAINASRSMVFELSPPVLYDLGLEKAIVWLAGDFEKRCGIKIAVTVDGAPKPLEDHARAIVFRAVRELLVNVIKHAKAPTANVSITQTGDQVRIDVEDSGVGFDPAAAPNGQGSGAFGLFSVREQITRLGGELKIASGPQRGTVVSVSVPLQASAASCTSDGGTYEGNERP